MKKNLTPSTHRVGNGNGNGTAAATHKRSTPRADGDFMLGLVTALDRVREGDFSARVASGYVGIEGRGGGVT